MTEQEAGYEEAATALAKAQHPLLAQYRPESAAAVLREAAEAVALVAPYVEQAAEEKAQRAKEEITRLESSLENAEERHTAALEKEADRRTEFEFKAEAELADAKLAIGDLRIEMELAENARRRAEAALAKERQRLVAELGDLAPHEVKCRCGHGGVFDWEHHAEDCPRHEVGAMLDALDSQQEESDHTVIAYVTRNHTGKVEMEGKPGEEFDREAVLAALGWEQEEKPAPVERCPSCGSRNPWFTHCKDRAVAEEETGQPILRHGGCTDSWHAQPNTSAPDAWLSSRPGLAEALPAFRSAFGTDTSSDSM